MEKNKSKHSKPENVQLTLEEIVHLTNKIGLEYAQAKKEAERLELLKPSVKSKIMMRLDDESMSETKLKRLSDTDPEYIEFLEKLAQARGESDRLKIRYDSYRNLFEAKRSMLSYQKAELKLI